MTARLQRLGAFAKRRPFSASVLTVVVLLAGVLGGYSLYVGAPPVIYRDGLFYMTMRQDAPWLPRAVRIALNDPNPTAEAGEVTWRRLAPGFEIGDVPVLHNGEEVDHLYLTRIDPRLYRFELRIDADNDLNAWMRDAQPAAVINASYYNAAMGAATPVRIDGAFAGPTEYDSQHGAFVSSDALTQFVDLANGGDWHAAMRDSDTAFVSYPTLVSASGENRAPESRWLASRSFIAQDADGLIILGSAPEGYFSLHRLGEFLRTAPLSLRYVLNLDGGPVACHGVAQGDTVRRIYGHIELQSDGEHQPLRVLPASRKIHALMPIVLAVFPRTDVDGTEEAASP
ncbi:MAG: phosphodiester glycosidase family protein [Alphaproteobacteria bacterium]|nr:phosphodiester glycosidase family protein [Alphaproteobacteria bacterium]